MQRWLAVGLGCLTALGMQALLMAVLGQAYAAQFVALVLAGFVAGHLAGQWQVVYGALAAVAYIFVTATLTAIHEVGVARQSGLGALAPIDFAQLALTDVVAMAGGSCGAWLAARFERGASQ
jgi:hypothetical protein